MARGGLDEPDPAGSRRSGKPSVNEATLNCPTCKNEIKLTESSAAPIVGSTHRLYEQKLAQKEAEVSKREEALRGQRTALVQAKESIDDQVEARVKSERERIASEEVKKARRAPPTDLKQTAKEVAEINEDAWATLYSGTSQPFDKPHSGRIAVKVINHLGDEVMKVFKVE